MEYDFVFIYCGDLGMVVPNVVLPPGLQNTLPFPPYPPLSALAGLNLELEAQKRKTMG